MKFEVYGKTQGKLIWPASFPPKNGEVLSSWLVRLSHAHGHKVHTFCSIICPGEQIWTRDPDLNPPKKLITQLENHTPSTSKQIRAALLENLEGVTQEKINHNGSNSSILSLGIFHRKRRLKGQQYCPSCLSNDGNDPYFRTLWRVAYNTICLDCNCYLNDECPHCSHPVMFHRQELGNKNHGPGGLLTNCYNCRLVISDQKKKRVPGELIEIQTQINFALQNGYIENIQYSHLYFRGLSALIHLLVSGSPSARHIQNLISHKSKIVLPPGPVEKTRATTFNKMQVAERANILLCCSWLLHENQKNLLQLMESRPRRFVSSMGEDTPLPFWLKRLID